MADQSDVETAIVAVLTDALAALPVGVFRGWPLARSLDEAFARGQALVTVLPVDGTYRLTTRHAPSDLPQPSPVTMAALVSDATVTFSGAAAAGQVAGIAVDNVAYAYRVVARDTTPSVAANVAALVRADRIAVLDGASVSVPGAAQLLGRVIADTVVARELRRQEQDFRVTCWCNAPDARDAIAAAADVALAQLPYLALGDGTVARMRSGGGAVSDEAEAAGLYRRDIVVRCDYPTVVATDLPAMLFGLAGAGARRAVG